MPNLKPPVTTTDQALAYRERIFAALDGAGIERAAFTPLMTLYLTDNTPADEVLRASESSAVHGIKLYPAGATTNSDAGVTDLLGIRRSEEHTSELQSLMRISYAVFCLKKKTKHHDLPANTNLTCTCKRHT